LTCELNGPASVSGGGATALRGSFVQIGQYLLTKHLAQNKHVHTAVDRTAKYELVAATLKSLDGLGFKVGFVNNDASASQ
jgi:hypothetical protein